MTQLNLNYTKIFLSLIIFQTVNPKARDSVTKRTENPIPIKSLISMWPKIGTSLVFQV